MSEKTTTLEFNAKALAPLSLFMAKNDIRYYLNGMCVMKHPSGTGCVIVATNGHHIGYWYDKEGVCDEQIVLNVGPGIVAAAKKRVRGNQSLPKKVRLVDGRLVLIENGYREVFVQAGTAEIDANYPDVWSIIPKKESLKPGLIGCLNTEYLRVLGDVKRHLGESLRYMSAVQSYTEESDDPIHFGKVVTCYDGIKDDFMVITMPMSGNVKLPDAFFIEPPKAESTKKAAAKKAAPKKKPATKTKKGGAA